MSFFINKIDYILKHNLKIQKIYKTVMSTVFKTIGIFIKTDEQLILFNAHGRKYNDSPKAIYEYMIENKLNNNYKYIWALDNPDNYNIPIGSKVKMDTISYFITALRAKYWVSCVNIERGLNFKKKQTVYLNTWHGTPLKLIGNAASGRNDFDFSNIDIFCYAGNYEKDIYLRDFNVRKESLVLSGLPRNDALYNITQVENENLKKKFNIPLNKKVILYAPTWRDSTDKGNSYAINPPIDIAYWEKELKDEYVILFRTHSYTNKILGIEFNDFVRDYSSYPEINHLLKVADILISDYSATIFDYSILEKPILCFGYDYEDYRSTRGFYLDLNLELPNSVIEFQEELIREIKNMNYHDESKKTAAFKKKYIEASGDATVMCVEKLLRFNN